ncbi:MAG: hypothetical protein M5R36_08945 [Deltaproteobacteria bacterium]|nr:hypothetical protein [Deltaproteobacteria bacterium]
MLFTCWGALAAVRFVEAPGSRRAGEYALVAVAAAFFRPDLGAILLIGFLATAFTMKRHKKIGASSMAIVAGSVAAYFAALALAIAASGNAGRMVEQLLDEVGKNTGIVEPAFPAPWAIFPAASERAKPV